MKIAIVSDTHFSTTDRLLTANWEAANSWIAATNPELLIHLGDITANGVHSGEELRYGREVLAGCRSEMLSIPGNHDIGDHAAGPGLPTDTPFDEARLAQYRTLFGMDRWSIHRNGWQMIGINAPLLATGLDEEDLQYTWLEQALSGRTGPVGVFLHKPLFRDQAAEDIVHTRYVPRVARNRLINILRGCDLRFVAAGHTHQVRSTWVDGVEHVWAPSTGFTIPDFRQEPIGEKLVGTLLLELDANHHRFTHIIPAGMVSHNLMELEHIYPALRDSMRPVQS
ncbi:MAG TPA: metallophosphoesterase [Steroidobacteraceae bacterium]|jgi:predicted phosphodiesterase